MECDPDVWSNIHAKEDAVEKALLDAFGVGSFKKEYYNPFSSFGLGVDRTACDMAPTKNARFDFVIENDRVFVVIEVDEAQHANYCGEIARANEAVTSRWYEKDFRHIHLIRFNPDAFKINEASGKVSIETRHARLIENVKVALESHLPQQSWCIQHMYYDTQDGQVCIMDEIPPMIQEICLPPIIA